MISLLLADITIGSIVTDIVGALSSLWTFMTGNPLLLTMIAAPVVLGLLYGFMSVFRK